ncbi:MAG: RagB/SusD family nutrient uptake outer membrane protein [Bacteroidales bacterium]|nr:RagB/SusD family nutrient uptake outer membrane protein [Bacteroidales bacterium]
MKRTLSYLAIAAAIFQSVSISCSKQLDAPVDDRVESMADVFSHYKRVQNKMSEGCVGPSCAVVGSGFTYGGSMLASYCDEAQHSNTSAFPYQWYQGKEAPGYEIMYGGMNWFHMFSSINHCNTGLQYVTDENLECDYDADIRTAFAAQFYIFRAYYYLYGIQRWGGLPILSRPYPISHDYSKDRRASFAECVDFIIASCDSALVINPNEADSDRGLEWRVSGYSSEQSWKCSRALAWAIKSRAALYAASPLWVDDCEGTEKYTWERAASICKEALDSCLIHGYSLFDSSTAFPTVGVNAYASYFLSEPSFGRGWDRETIYSPFNTSCVRSYVWANSGLPNREGQSEAGSCPTQELVDAYEVVSADGLSSAPVLDLKNPYDASHKPNISVNAKALGYDDSSRAMYENRDPRFYASIYYDGCEALDGEVINTCFGGNCAYTKSASERKNTVTGYYLRKFNNPSSNASANNDGFFRSVRLAELYYNFAEAAFNAYGPDKVIGDTNPMTARGAVNAVRARSGMPGITDDGEEFWLRYKNERRVEFAFEEHRFFDLRRWSRPNENLEATDRVVSAMYIDEGVYSRSLLTERNCFQNKYLLLPINQDEVLKMLRLTGDDWQNPGWTN